MKDKSSKQIKLVSIITPMYNEEKNVKPFYETLVETIKDLPYKFELIYVDDGSKDGSAIAAKRLEKLSNSIITIRLVKLARNFGKEIATTAGLHSARGDAAIILDSDLQHPINLIPEFIEKWQNGSDVVIGVRSNQGHNNKLKTVGSKLFYFIMNKISDTNMIPHSTDYRLVDRQVIDSFKAFTEKQRITRGLIDWLGFNRDTIEFTPNERIHGEPAYSFSKMFRLALSSFTMHSLLPLRLAGYVGVSLMLVFGFFGLTIFVQGIVMNDFLGWSISGTAMLAVLLLFTIGIVLSCLGLMAMYIAVIHGEVMNRPLFIVHNDRRHDLELES